MGLEIFIPLCSWPEFTTEKLFKAHWKDDGNRKEHWKYLVSGVYQPVYADKSTNTLKEGWKGKDVYVDVFKQTIQLNEDWFTTLGRFTDYDQRVLIVVDDKMYRECYIAQPEHIEPEPTRNRPQNEANDFVKKRARGAPRAPGAQRKEINREINEEYSSDEEDEFANEVPIAQEEYDIEGQDEPERDEAFFRVTNTSIETESNDYPIFDRRGLGKTTETQYINRTPWEIVKTLFRPVFSILKLNNTQGDRLIITEDELFGWFAIITMMSIIKLENYESYFETENELLEFKFHPREYMSFNRFKEIRAKLKTYDDDDDVEFPNNKAWKVMDISTALKHSFRSITKAPRQHLAMDEAMINYTGDRNPIRTTIPNKPNNGIRLFCLVEVETKILIDFNLDDKTDDADNCRHFPGGFTGRQVLKLLSDDGDTKRWDAVNLIVYIDNYYTGVHLLRKLLNMGIRCIGTIKKSRLPLVYIEGRAPGAQNECPNFKPSATLSRPTLTNPRGTVKVSRTNGGRNKIYIYSIMDSALFFMGDTAYGPYHKEMMRRRSGANIEEYQVPKAVNVYNKYMNGVDVVDQLSWGDFNVTTHRSKRWTLRYLEALWGLTITNAYSIYKEVNRDHRDLSLSHGQFRRKLVQQMFSSPEVQRLKAGHVTRGKIRKINDAVNVGVGNLCILTQTLPGSHPQDQGRRLKKDCQGEGKRHQTTYYCASCNMSMCPKCFDEFHLRED